MVHGVQILVDDVHGLHLDRELLFQERDKGREVHGVEQLVAEERRVGGDLVLLEVGLVADEFKDGIGVGHVGSFPVWARGQGRVPWP